MTRITFALCAMFALASGQAADSGDDWLDANNYTDVARWMIEQSDVELRAAGLAALAEAGPAETAIGPGRYMAEVKSIIDGDPTGAAVYMIAQGCHRLDLLQACSDAGVPEALKRLDGGNPLAATLFHDQGSPEVRQVLMEAEQIDDHYPEIVSAWFEALVDRKADEMEEGTEMIVASSIAMAAAIPTLQPILERCRSAVESDKSLDRACQRLSEQMRTFGRTLFLKKLGFGMAKRRAERLGDEALVAKYESESEALVTPYPSECAFEAVSERLATDINVVRRFLAEMRAYGEEAAFRMLYDEYGSSCGQ